MDRFADNPFFVLGLRPEASRVEIEREGQRLVAMLELELSAVERYATPLGERERTVDKLRWALAELRDPERRLEHELWARLGADLVVTVEPRRPAPAGEETRRRTAPFPGALAALGWRRP